jgi:hypothetical protein
MCFMISYRDPEPHIADFDIPVWKVVVCLNDVEYTGPYYGGLIYYEGHPSPRVELDPHYGQIDEGYHCFTNVDMAHYKMEEIIDECNEYPINQPRTFAVKRFIIPTGAIYYIDRIGEECVASQVVMKEEM